MLNEFTVKVMLEANPELTERDLLFPKTMKDKQYIEEYTLDFEEYLEKNRDK